MTVREVLRNALEEEERSTVSNAFGGVKSKGKTKSYSVSKIRDLIITAALSNENELDRSLSSLKKSVDSKTFKLIVGNLIRFSFLIELTNLTVGSTKMKTRWLPGLILMPQDGSFEPIQGSFEPGNDPRSSSFEVCCSIFAKCIDLIKNKIVEDPGFSKTVSSLASNTSVPYEFLFDYIDSTKNPVHTSNNIELVSNEDIDWLIRARPIIWPALTKQQKDKIQTKTYKTDRALTGKDKTNRAKRWEVLCGDFQHATLTQCWSVERKLLAELVGFENFPQEIKQQLQEVELIASFESSRCPVTLEPLSFDVLMSPAVHGRSDYQVGHLHPLKRTGKHEGSNVCWQSSDGNRIQGDLTIEETIALLDQISQRKNALGQTHLAIVNEEIAVDA